LLQEEMIKNIRITASEMRLVMAVFLTNLSYSLEYRQ
jgi:hypothetical protein